MLTSLVHFRNRSARKTFKRDVNHFLRKASVNKVSLLDFFFRNTAELPYLSRDRSYDFNYQETRMLPEERQILPGDGLQVVCDYKTQGVRQNITVVSKAKKKKI